MKQNRFLKPVIWLTLVCFLFTHVQGVEKREAAYISPISSFAGARAKVVTPFKKPPSSKPGRSLRIGAFAVALMFGPTAFPQVFQSAVLMAQEQNSEQQTINALKEVHGYLKQMRETQGLNREREILQSLQKVRRYDNTVAIRHLLELLKAAELDYGRHDGIYQGLLETLLSILDSHKEEILPQLTLKKYWQRNDNSPIELVPFFIFPRNTRVGDIPKILLQDSLRRIELDAKSGSQYHNQEDYLVNRLAAQSFRLYVLAFNKGLFSDFDATLFQRSVRGVKVVVSQYRGSNGQFLQARLVMGLLQGFAGIQLTDSNRPIVLKSYAELRRFALGKSFNEQAKPQKYLLSADVHFQTDLILSGISLKPETVSPAVVEAPVEEKPTVAPEPETNFFMWAFLSILSLLSGFGLSWFILNKRVKKSVPKRRSRRPKLRVHEVVDGEQISPFAEPEVYPDLPDKQVGSFLLKQVIAKAPEGFVRQAYLQTNNGIKELGIIEKGPFLIEHSTNPQATQHSINRLPDGSLLKKAFLYNNNQWKTLLVSFKGPFAVIGTPLGTVEMGQIRKGQLFVPFNLPVYLVYQMDEESGRLVGQKKFIVDGDLLIEHEPDKTSPSLFPSVGKAYRAYSISQEKWLTVTPFAISEDKVYWLTGKLGQGGMGAVLKALDPRANRNVAIKVSLSTDTKDAIRFEQEARVAASLTHRNVVQTHAFGFHPVMYIVMEMLKGRSLEDVVSEELTLDQILDIGIQAAEGLKYVHGKGVIHRDLKPANLFQVQEEGDSRIVLTDFGLVREGAGAGLTQTGEIVGTPAFMPPEQALGKTSQDELRQGESASNVDTRSDLYSLGAILYALATGQPPFIDQEVMAVLLKVSLEADHKNIKPISELRDEVPREFEELVQKTMAYKKEDRFQTAEELIQALKQLRLNMKSNRVTFHVGEETKKIAKVVLIVSALIALFLFSIPLWKKWRGSKKENASSASTNTRSQPPVFQPTPWNELKRLSFDRFLEKINKEIEKLKGANKARYLYYRALRRFEETVKNRSDLEYRGKLRQALNDLKKALDLADPTGEIRDVKFLELYLLKIKLEAALGEIQKARAGMLKIEQRLQREEGNEDVNLKRIKEELKKLKDSLNQISAVPMPQPEIYQLTALERSA